MKKTITKTVTETQSFCDHCGKPVVYSEQGCIVCGKLACHECFHTHLTELRLDQFPAFWPPLKGLPRFDAYACKGCSNKITRRFHAVKGKTERINAQCKGWFKWYCSQIETLVKWQNKAAKNNAQKT